MELQLPVREAIGMATSDDDVLRLIRGFLGGARVAGPVPAAAIAAAEAELGVVFPRSYRIFVANFGAALGPGFEVAGMLSSSTTAAEPPMYSDVVVETRRFRAASVPPGLVPISSDGCDAVYCLDTSLQSGSHEAPVIIWGPVSDHGQVVASDFLQFLRSASAPDA